MGGEETTGRSWPGVQEQLSRKSPREFREEFLKCMLEMICCHLEQGREVSHSAVFWTQPLTPPLRSLVAISFSLLEGQFEVWGHSPRSYLTSRLESLRLFVRKKCMMLGTATGGLKSECKYKFFFWPLSFLLIPSFHGGRHRGQGRVCWLQATRVSFRC